jgi:hypothetical protein
MLQLAVSSPKLIDMPDANGKLGPSAHQEQTLSDLYFAFGTLLAGAWTKR